MFHAVLVTSDVTKPDIVASVSKDQTRGLIFIIEDHTVARVQKTVLKIDNRKARLEGCLIFSLDSEESQDITIFSGDLVSFNRISEGFHDIREGNESVRAAGDILAFVSKEVVFLDVGRSQDGKGEDCQKI